MGKRQLVLTTALAVTLGVSCADDGDAVQCNSELRVSSLSVEFPEDEVAQELPFEIYFLSEGIDVTFTCPGGYGDYVLGGDNEPPAEGDIVCTPKGFNFIGEAPASVSISATRESRVFTYLGTPEYVYIDRYDADARCHTDARTATAVLEPEQSAAFLKAFRPDEEEGLTNKSNGQYLCDVADVQRLGLAEEDHDSPMCDYAAETPQESSAFEVFTDAQLAADEASNSLFISNGTGGRRPEIVRVYLGDDGQGCEAVTLTGTLLLTAAHCIAGKNDLGNIAVGDGTVHTNVGPIKVWYTFGGWQTPVLVYEGNVDVVINDDYDGDPQYDVGLFHLQDRMSHNGTSNTYYRSRVYSSTGSPPTAGPWPWNSWYHYVWSMFDGTIQPWATTPVYQRFASYYLDDWTAGSDGVEYSPTGSAGVQPGDSGSGNGFASQSWTTNPNYSNRYVVESIQSQLVVSPPTSPQLGHIFGARTPEAWNWLDTNPLGSACDFKANGGGCSQYTSYGWPYRRCTTGGTCPGD